MPEAEIIYEGDDAVLKELSDDHREDYAIRVGALYVEFSHVQWQDHVLLLLSKEDGAYVSIRHDTGEDDITDELHDKLIDIQP